MKKAILFTAIAALVVSCSAPEKKDYSKEQEGAKKHANEAQEDLGN